MVKLKMLYIGLQHRSFFD
ncbi:hypothetical protein BU183_18610, partial [Enterococcus faecium]